MTRVRGTSAKLPGLPGTLGGRHPHAVGAESSAGPAGASMLVTLTAADLRALVVDAVADVLAELAAPSGAPELVDAPTLARRLSVSRSTVHRMRTAGMPAIRMGETFRFRVADCIAWLEARS